MKSVHEVVQKICEDLRQIEYKLPVGDARVALHQSIVEMENLAVRVREELGK